METYPKAEEEWKKEKTLKCPGWKQSPQQNINPYSPAQPGGVSPTAVTNPYQQAQPTQLGHDMVAYSQQRDYPRRASRNSAPTELQTQLQGSAYNPMSHE